MKKDKKIVNEKFYSFLNATLLGPNQRQKFPQVFNIPIYDKANWKFGHIKFVSKRNKIVLCTILRGYLIFWFAVFCAAHIFYENFKKDMLLKTNKINKTNKTIMYKRALSKNMFDIDIFYYFFRNSFNEFFEANDYISDIAESFMCDLNYIEQLRDKYNLRFFYALDFFFVVLNIEELKYEHDKVLTPEKDWDKIKKKN